MTDQIIHINNKTYDLAHHTPMMVQYLTTKVNYPNSLMLYRMGDFYELFFEDAKLAAELLDITLTRRGNDKAGNEIPMAGVPFHAADSYMARMIAKGQTVVICEQIEETQDTELESDANDNKKIDTLDKDNVKGKSAKAPPKGIMKREVVRTLTAGTITDEALFSANQDSSHTPNVVSLDIKKTGIKHTHWQVGISSLDLSAGTITAQTIDADNLDALKNEMATILARFAPSECLLNEKLNFTTHHTQNEKTAWLLPWLHEQLHCPIIDIADSDFSLIHAPTTLCQQFDVKHIDGLGIHESPLIQSTAASLIHYARQTQQRQIPHVNQLIIENNQDYLILDDICQRNLEIAHSISTGGTSLLTVLNHCKTPMGKRLLPQQIKRPLRNRESIMLRSDAIANLITLASSHNNEHHKTALENIKETLTRIADIERISSRISLGSAKPRDLVKLANAINSSQHLATQLKEFKQASGLLALLIQQLPPSTDSADNEATDNANYTLTEIVNLLEIAIVEEPPAHIRDGGMIKEGYDQELDVLNNLHDNVQETLDDMAQTHRDTYSLPSLKVGFNKVSGFYFELPSSQAKSAPEIFVRRQTLKSCERYVTEELKTLETDYLNAQSSALAREKQLYNQLLIQLAKHISDIQQLAQAVAHIDVLTNWASLAHTYQWQRPTLTNTVGELVIKQGRHLVVEAGMLAKQQQGSETVTGYQSTQFIANDCVMGGVEGNGNKTDAKLLLITGPNMGGKSTYMRQIALIVLLASCGSFVPAQSAVIGDIDRIFTRIGSADDLAGGKSTFMVEMIETAHILNLATNKSLVLMDEVGRGTSTTDGLAVAYACVQKLADMKCLTLFATHYFELTALAEQDDRMRNRHVVASEVEGKLLLLHQVRDGFASSSFGLHVAKMAGVPADVLEQAKQYLTSSLNQDTTKNIASTKQQIELFACDKSVMNLSNTHSTNPMPNTSGETLKKLAQLKNINEIITTVNPDEMTPKQALEWVYSLKERI